MFVFVRPLLLATTWLIAGSWSAFGQSGLVLNELVTSNITGLPDEYEEDLQNCPVPNCPGWYEDLGRSIFDGEYPDWIELYNGTDTDIELEGYVLTDREDPARGWTFPEVVIGAGQFLVVFASGKDKQEDYLHTNFKLSRTGERVRLLNPQGQVVDQVDTGELPVDYALARDPQAPEEWLVFDRPTPGEVNGGNVHLGFDDDVIFEPAGGFYDRFPSVTLSTTNEAAEVRYTLDGSVPTPDSTLFTRPITALFGGDRVVRARTFVDGVATSAVLTQSYITERTFNMPVVSLTTDPMNLWDEDLGIYTPGKNAREGDRVANYWNEWERPVHVEFFEPDGTVGFAADAGLRIFGWGSRSDPQKSFAVMFRDRYGLSALRYPLFPEDEIDFFKAFVLRAAGSDSRGNGTFFRDPFATSLLKGRNVDTQAFRPAAVYINGEYWGIQNIREKMNEDYLASHHDIDPDDVDLISRYWRRRHPVVIEGDSERYLAFEAFLEEQDLSQTDAYEEALRWIDFDNYVEYTAAQIYLSNFDWPGNNNKNWSPRGADGRWRWLMYDLDYTQGFNGDSNFQFNTVRHALSPSGSGWPNPSWTTLIFRKLSENESFRHAFANRMADLANSRLGPEYAIEKLDQLEAFYAPEMEHHISRWKREGNSLGSMSTWRSNIETVRTFFERRSEFALGHVRDAFDLGEIVDLTLAFDPSEGSVQVNSTRVTSGSWTGQYFGGVPVTVNAVPRPGYRFVRWDGGSDDPTWAVDPGNAPERLAPVFAVAADDLNTITFTEINYHSDPENDLGDWIELTNAFNQAMDLSGWIFQDSSSAHRFTLPAGTVLLPGRQLVLCQDAAAFTSVHPDVACVGDFRFGLANEGERLRLLDAESQVIDEVLYDDSDPFPVEADGGGATLSREPGATTWQAAPNFGTPGRLEDSVVSPPVENAPKVIWVGPDGSLFLRWREAGDGGEPGIQRSVDLKDWEPWVPRESDIVDESTIRIDPANLPRRQFFRPSP